ncbi:vesicle-associated protein 1-2-like isoform X2 [Mangifera indica]|nr:vesicle-associated protein 1-2-like isoform X2 [Mangifera indica]XP_044499361.1 vesicle-associated protein 1-2-like isoform X2 [Mangifera indica]XP_044499362.1 vesicle-associated protein 1-2-like isoform X2 [Mangifera indica]
MAKELLEIQPLELKFTFEVKKQSSCSIQLGNKSDQYVAFKVKTTSPKKYCVRPNVGIIKPRATFDFAVTMQAQRIAPPDLQCKDKFLIQSTVVAFGTTDEDITSDMFAKDNGKRVDEKKLRVVLISPPQSPILLPRNGEPFLETSLQKDVAPTGVENIHPSNNVADDVEGPETGKVAGELRPTKDVQGLEMGKDTDELRAAEDVSSRPAKEVTELKIKKDILELNLAKDFEELKSKLNLADSQLREAEHTIKKLTEESGFATREKDRLKHVLEVLQGRKNRARTVQVGFPLLYVCMVALISLVLGYLSHR